MVQAAKELGDEPAIFEATYHLLIHMYGAHQRREDYVSCARELLSVRPSSLQLALYIAEDLFHKLDEPGLARDMVEHGYSAITDAQSALEELGTIRQAKQLVFVIEGSLDPWSEETGQAMMDLAYAGSSGGSEEAHVIEVMKTITNRPTDNWLDAFIQKMILQSLWSKRAGEQHLRGTDHQAQLDELEAMYRNVPDLTPAWHTSNRENADGGT